MVTYLYTGRLTDVAGGTLAAVSPVLRVRPETEAFGPDGIVSEHPVMVPVDGAGNFSMSLFPSGELTAGWQGTTGVRYILSVGLEHGAWLDVWRFTATAGGGPVAGMAGGSMLAVWPGPPWPPLPLPKGMYIDTVDPNPWGIVT